MPTERKVKTKKIPLSKKTITKLKKVKTCKNGCKHSRKNQTHNSQRYKNIRKNFTDNQVSPKISSIKKLKSEDGISSKSLRKNSSNLQTHSEYLYFKDEIPEDSTVNFENLNGDKEEKTIFVSLNFLENSKNYKVKFRNLSYCKNLMKLKKNVEKISSYHRRFLSKNREPEISKSKSRSVKDEDVNNNNTPNISENQLPKNKKENPKIFSKNSETERKISEKTLIISKKESPADNYSKIIEKPSPVNTPSKLEVNVCPNTSAVGSFEENISKIDLNYIKSLLQLTTNKKNGGLKNLINFEKLKRNIIQRGEIANEKSNIDQNGEKIEKENLENSKTEKINKISSPMTKSKNLSQVFSKISGIQIKRTNTKLLHALTKSKILGSNTESMKDANSKTDAKKKVKMNSSTVNKNESKTKKKTFKHNIEKKKNEGTTEEDSDLKEIWRSNIVPTSEHSLSSHSSVTMTTKDEVANLGIESYKTLKKIVEEEIFRISKNHIKENIKKEKKNKFTSEKKEENNYSSNTEKINKSIKEKHKIENSPKEKQEVHDKNNVTVQEKQKNSMNNNLGTLMSVPISNTLSDLFTNTENKLNNGVHKRIEQTQTQKNINSKKRKQIKKLVKSNALRKDKSEDITDRTKMKTLSEKDWQRKIPSEIIKNWSILHRLQKAFIALGTLNKQDPHALEKSEIILRSKIIKVNNSIPISNDKLKIGKRKMGKVSSVESEEKTTKKTKNTTESDGNDDKKKVTKNRKIKKSKAESPKKNDKTIESIFFAGNLDNLQKNSKKIINENSLNKRVKSGTKRSALKSSHQNSENKKPSSKSDIVNTTKWTEHENDLKKQKSMRIKSNKKTDSESKISKKDKHQIKMDAWIESKEAFIKPSEIHKHTSREKKLIKALLSSYMNANEADNLERKKTFYTIPRKDFNMILPQKSKSYTKNEGNIELNLKSCFSTFRHLECIGRKTTNAEFWHLFKKNNASENKTKNKEQPDKQKNEKNVIKSAKSSKGNNIFEKFPDVKEKVKSDYIKKSLKSLSDASPKPSKAKIVQLKKCEKMVPVEGVSQQKQTVKNDQKITNVSEKPVKERSILSISRNQRAKKSQVKVIPQTTLIKSPRSSKYLLTTEESDQPLFEINKSSRSKNNSSLNPVNALFTRTENHLHTNNSLNSHFKNKPESKSNENLIPSFVSKTSNSEKSKPKIEIERPFRPLKEQYDAMVKDILEQYNKIDCLLKQKKLLEKMNKNSNNSKEDSSLFSKISQNLKDYGNKNFPEYKTYPIFEYKYNVVEQQRKKESEANGKRNSTNPKVVNTQTNLEAKGFQPNEFNTMNLLKRINASLKARDSSLSFSNNTFTTNKKEFENIDKKQNSSSTPKAFGSTPPSTGQSKKQQKPSQISQLETPHDLDTINELKETENESTETAT